MTKHPPSLRYSARRQRSNDRMTTGNRLRLLGIPGFVIRHSLVILSPRASFE
jgi:hypothetical protein